LDNDTLMCDDTQAEQSEADLLDAAAKGDLDAFWKFCVRVMPTLLSAQKAQCRQYGLPADLAQDFVDEALVHTVQWIRSNEGRTISASFLKVVSRNKMIDWMRRHRRVNRLKAPLPVEEVQSPEPKKSIESDIMKYYSELSDQDQEILALILFQNKSPQEAAAILGIEGWAAYKRYERALKRLKLKYITHHTF
jgi:RNA polymerase sigma factor (sigma-70 family)